MGKGQFSRFEMNVEVNNGILHTLSLGSGEHPLLIIHGGPDWDHSYLLDAAEALSETTRVILFDLRGCGRSTRFEDPTVYSIEHVVNDITAVLDAYDVDRCNLLGFSFGGRVALQFLAKHPDRIHKLILASTTATTDFQADLDQNPLYQERFTPEMREQMGYAFKEAPAVGQEPSRTLALETLPLDIYDLSRLSEMKATIEKIHFSCEWIKAFRHGSLQSDPVDFEALLRQADKPLLVLHGEHDLRFPVSMAQQLARQIPTSHLAVIANAGHLAHLEQPAEWVSAISTFITL